MFDLTPEEFRAHGHRVIDLLADHLAARTAGPVRRQASRAELEALLDLPFAAAGRPFEEVLDFVNTRIVPHTMRVSHPRFFGFVPSPGNGLSALAETIAATVNVFAGTYMGGASATLIERQTMRWLAGEAGLPPAAGGITVSGGSYATLTALAAALHHRGQGAAYFSDQTHSAVERALRALGVTTQRKLPTDGLGRLDIAALASAIAADQAAGIHPCCVIANAGTTSTGAVDDLPAVAALARRHGLWYHIDGAYGGGAVVAPRGRAALAGIELADSLALDPHKWLFQPFDLGCVLVRDERLLLDTFHVMPDYLKDIERLEAHVNPCDRGLELSRPFRVLKLWLSLQVFGTDALRAAVARGFELAEFAEQRLRASAVWEILTPAQMAIVTFRHKQTDATVLADRLAATGYALLTTTKAGGHPALRFCTINPNTTESDLETTIARIESLA
jgi:glutamate/tyrosine decarboxylase-like PLP-dependent enzyme